MSLDSSYEKGMETKKDLELRDKDKDIRLLLDVVVVLQNRLEKVGESTSVVLKDGEKILVGSSKELLDNLFQENVSVGKELWTNLEETEKRALARKVHQETQEKDRWRHHYMSMEQRLSALEWKANCVREDPLPQIDDILMSVTESSQEELDVKLKLAEELAASRKEVESLYRKVNEKTEQVETLEKQVCTDHDKDTNRVDESELCKQKHLVSMLQQQLESKTEEIQILKQQTKAHMDDFEEQYFKCKRANKRIADLTTDLQVAKEMVSSNPFQINSNKLFYFANSLF